MESVSGEAISALAQPSPGGLVFARRKKSPFKGAMLNSGLFGLSIGPGQASPAIRSREGSAGRLNLGLQDLRGTGSVRSRGNRRKSQIIEEEEEGEEEAIEEVDAFEPVDLHLRKGERVHSVTVWDEGGEVQQEGRTQR